MSKITITANKFPSNDSGILSKRCKSCYIWMIFNVKLGTAYSHGPRYLGKHMESSGTYILYHMEVRKNQKSLRQTSRINIFLIYKFAA